ncbi:ribose transport system ATP-binding protein [Pseudoxanthobacter soli DSM 19599]|uniref:Ribose transport system ATP-binding protein n=1 Tax=Pseudoxanthobacter soli DSM 19599 TaxID=1123029 RepID=A0A1M7ZNS4_9HYPH|nr:sugar ABC transporter ATP-binding protein [Pseudoxanthobacter soli]SHO66527.1 ribose transport system ATP-binding protein [Pseudoxanthobacter soli DSM 19599]
MSDNTRADAPVLELRDLRKDFSGVEVLKGISLSFERGEVHGILGENGAGKSTLIKILTGVYSHSSGDVLLNGEPVVIHKPADARRHGIGAVYQDAELAGSFTVAESILLGAEPGGAFVKRKAIRREASEIMAQIGITLDPDRLVSTLSAAEAQMVTLATLFHRRYKIIILDEPTARLSATEADLLFALIETFRREGITILYISHRLGEVRQLCDRATILRDGRVSGTLRRGEIQEDVVTTMMVNRSASDLDIANPGLAQQRVVLEMRQVSTARLAPFDISVRAGEVLGITGPVGSGMEQIERILGGLGAFEGEVRVNGTAVRLGSPGAAQKAGIALIPEERRKQALFPNLSLGENVSLPALDKLSSLGLVSSSRKRVYADAIIDRLHVFPKAPDRPIRFFSGGNQQKAVIGKWLERKASIYVFVEPTSGVDVGAIRQIYEVILGMAAAGAAIVVISTSIKELLALSETIAVIHDGTVSASGPRGMFDRDSLLALAMGKRQLASTAVSI